MALLKSRKRHISISQAFQRKFAYFFTATWWLLRTHKNALFETDVHRNTQAHKSWHIASIQELLCVCDNVATWERNHVIPPGIISPPLFAVRSHETECIVDVLCETTVNTGVCVSYCPYIERGVQTFSGPKSERSEALRRFLSDLRTCHLRT